MSSSHDLTPSDRSRSVPDALEGSIADTPTPELALDRLRRQRGKLAGARAELEARVVAAKLAGVALRPIAEAAGVSHEEVRRIVARAGA